MQASAFKQLLLEATARAKAFALNFVKNELPEDNVYDLHLSVSHDDPSLTQFDIYPEDNGKIMRSASADLVVQTLLRKGKVPVWIDINVAEVRKGKTALNLLCAGRYSDDQQELYYHQSGLGPFGVKSPYLPVDYKEGEQFRIPETKKWTLANLFTFRPQKQ